MATRDTGGRSRAWWLAARRMALVALPWVLLGLALAAGSAWQWHGRAHQWLDIGTPADEGYVLSFNERERSSSDSSLTFRWAMPSSAVRLWAAPPGAPAVLTLRMLPPARHDALQRVSVSVLERPVARVALAPQPRLYRFLVAPPEAQELAIGLESDRLSIDGDPRAFGAGLDDVGLDTLRAPSARDLLRELWMAPFLPFGLLLLAICGFWLRLPPLLAGGTPALALAALILLDRWLPPARLMLVLYLTGAAFVLVVALALVVLFRRAAWLRPGDDRRALRWMLLAFVLALLTSFVPIVAGDGVGYYAYLRSLAMDGDLHFANEYRAEVFRHRPENAPLTSTGHPINPWSIGPALVWSQFYGVAHVLVSGGRALGMPWRADGYDSPYLVLSMFASALAGLVTMLAGYRICRRWVAPPVATLAVVSAFFGSNLLFYAMREGSFAHALSAAAASVYVLTWLRLEERPSVRRWAALGAAAGAMMLIYWISALVLLLAALTFVRLLIEALRSPAGQRGEQLARLFLGGTVAAGLLVLVFSPQLIAWKIIYGSFITAPQGADYIRPRWFRGTELLFLPLHGLLPWTPAFFAGLVELPLLWRRDRWLAGCLVPALLIYFWYNASLYDWHGSGAFGLRRITVLAAWFMIGLALLFDKLRRWSPAAPLTIAALMSTWTTLLLVRYDLYLLPHAPTQLEAMSSFAFYLSRDALPLWGVPGWLRSGYFASRLAASSPASAAELAANVVIMALATWGVLAVFRRLTGSAGRLSERYGWHERRYVRDDPQQLQI